MNQRQTTPITNDITLPKNTSTHPGIPDDFKGKTVAGAKRNQKQAPTVPPVVDPLAEFSQSRTQADAEKFLMEQDQAAPAPESIEELEDMDVVKAKKGEGIAEFENRIMAATVQGAEAIEVEPRIIQFLLRSRVLPAENYVLYRGIKVCVAGKMQDVLDAERVTVNEKLFPHGYGNEKLDTPPNKAS